MRGIKDERAFVSISKLKKVLGEEYPAVKGITFKFGEVNGDKLYLLGKYADLLTDVNEDDAVSMCEGLSDFVNKMLLPLMESEDEKDRIISERDYVVVAYGLGLTEGFTLKRGVDY